MIYNAAVLKKPGQFIIETKALHDPEAGYAQVNFLYCGVCGTDLSYYRGHRKDYPISLGHEFVARVVKSNQSSTHGMLDSIVVSDLNFRCGSCENCSKGMSHLCVMNDSGAFTNRGFAQYANINENYLLHIEPFSFLPRACLIEPLSCCIHSANMSSAGKKLHILVNGCGSMGSLMVFLLKQVYSVPHVYVRDMSPARADNCTIYFGAEHYTTSMAKHLDLIIDCSGDINGLAFSLESTLQGREVCIISHVYEQETSFVYEKICKNELIAYFPLRNGQFSNLELAYRYLANTWKDSYDEIIKIYRDVDSAFSSVTTSPFNKHIVDVEHSFI